MHYIITSLIVFYQNYNFKIISDPDANGSSHCSALYRFYIFYLLLSCRDIALLRNAHRRFAVFLFYQMSRN